VWAEHDGCDGGENVRILLVNHPLPLGSPPLLGLDMLLSEGGIAQLIILIIRKRTYSS
jgi:hypothetical protein